MILKTKHYSLIIFISFFNLLFFACDVMEDVVNTIPLETTTTQLTESEIRDGLTEALEIGLSNAVGYASAVDGFYKNEEIFVPFPVEAYKVRKAALDFHLDAQVEKFEKTLNRAAEKAAAEVKPVFIDALKEMTYTDARSILKGEDNAATTYFRQKTEKKLQDICYPKVADVTSRVELTKYWEPIINVYNKARLITGDPEINPDLNAYVTAKTIDGLFVLIEKEEKQIRENPEKRVTELLKKVFGSV